MCRRGPEGLEVVLGHQRDRLTGARTIRLPKGRLEEGESHEAAALREVAEETGLQARILAALGSVSYSYRERGGRVGKQVHFFLMEPLGGDFEGAEGELEDLAWWLAEAALDRLSYDTEREALGRALERAAEALA